MANVVSGSSPRDATRRCDVDVLSVTELSEEIFANEYYLQRPLLITGILPREAVKFWNIRYLRRNYGDAKVGVGSSRTIFKNGGTGGPSVTLDDFLDYVVNKSKQMPRSDPEDLPDNFVPNTDIFAFDRNSALFNAAPELFASMQTVASSVLGGNFEPQKKAVNTSDWDYYFSLGGRDSGVHLHHHGDGWSYLWSGQKVWFFRPPQTLPYISHLGFMSMRYWMNKGVFPKLREEERPLVCRQLPNEFMYIPESFWHGTLNLGDPFTLSFAGQRSTANLATDLETRMLKGGAVGAKNNRKAIKFWRKTVKRFPKNAEAWMVLGQRLGRNRQRGGATRREREYRAKLRSHELTGGGRNCDVSNNLASSMIHTNRFEEAEIILREIARLCEWDDFAWKNLAAALERQGRVSEAEKAFEMGESVLKRWREPMIVNLGDQRVML